MACIAGEATPATAYGPSDDATLIDRGARRVRRKIVFGALPFATVGAHKSALAAKEWWT